jgi:hypothetical protein
VAANPLLDAFEKATATGADIDDTRSQLITRYGFAIPSEEALGAIWRCSPRGVIEVGAGTGYWAYVLQQGGGRCRRVRHRTSARSAEPLVRGHPGVASGSPW